jgi:hypothetical protein
MIKHPTQKPGMVAAAFFPPLSIKGAAFIVLIMLIVMLTATGYFLEWKAERKRLTRLQKQKLGPHDLDQYLCSVRDKKLNELLLAKHHEPIHPN